MVTKPDHRLMRILLVLLDRHLQPRLEAKIFPLVKAVECLDKPEFPTLLRFPALFSNDLRLPRIN